MSVLSSLNYLAIFVIALGVFFIGGLWYSPLLFVKPWIREMKLTEEDLKKGNAPALALLKSYLLTVVSTFAITILVTLHHSHSARSGAEMGLLIGAGIVASREATNAVFEKRTFRHYAIVAGHDVVVCVVTGALVAIWR